MDGNKDEALKCLKIGKSALESGNKDRALKFLSKARRLDPSLPVDDLLASAGGDGGAAHAPGDPSPPENTTTQEEIPSLRTEGLRSRTSKASSSSSSSSQAYTDEQITVVRKIKKEKDYYKILGLEKDCTVEDVRKAYRKLSLKVHPDKNQAPGSDEAFKLVSKAFQCLSNEETRKRYDIVGSEEPNYERPAARHHYGGVNGFYEAEIDPDEIFRQFFFGGMHPAAATQFGTFRFRTGRPTGHETHGSGGFNVRHLIQLLPILIFLLFNLLPTSEPIYSFSNSYPYQHKMETSRGAPYYVKSAKFEQDYPYQSSQRISLEHRIDREYYNILAQNCRVELQRRQWGISRDTTYCDLLEEFHAATSA